MIEKLNAKKIYSVESYKYLGDDLYYSRQYPVYTNSDYHPSCCTCIHLFNCPYNEAKSNSRYGKETLCMNYVYYNSFNTDIVYLKYSNDNSRRRYTLMSCGIPYKYDKTLY